MPSSEQSRHEKPASALEERPPLLGSWRNLYLVVLGNLALLILLFWLFTRIYS